MMTTHDLHEVDKFRALITRRLGLQFDDTKRSFLSDVLRRRSDVNGREEADYLARLGADPSTKELGLLAQELTVPETYFFRNIEQFRALAEAVLPERICAQASQKTLRFLSAACASGEEPYSIAMVLRQAAINPSWKISIRAVDINRAVLEKASHAHYSNWALREIPTEMEQRWFKHSGSEFILDETIRRAVNFEQASLVENNPDLWQPSAYDVVFCRNLIMYFTPQAAQSLIDRIAQSLVPGGYLFLGHAETLRGLSQHFDLCHTHGTFYYQRKVGTRQTLPQIHFNVPTIPIELPVLSTAIETSDTWIEAIGHAAERIRTLSDQAPTQSAAEAIPRPHWHLGMAIDLLHKERFSEALELIETLPPEAARDPDVLLLHAVLLSHGGELVEAELMCEQLLALSGMNAGAHYVMALCREHAGARDDAIDHDQVAVYLNRTFAMPRLHLGLLARKAGDDIGVRRELEQAILLLKREDASRLLLFGGGFNRQALIALCEAECARQKAHHE